MFHGNLDDIVCLGNGLHGQSVALVAHDDGQAWLGLQTGIGEEDGVVAKCHGHGLETMTMQGFGDGTFETCPRDEKDATHGDADGTTVIGVAAGGCDQHSIDAKGGSGTEDGTYVGGVDNAVHDADSSSRGDDLLNWTGLWTSHGAKHAAGEGVACERSEHLAAAGVDRDSLGTVGPHGESIGALDDVGGIASDVTLFAEESEGLVTSVEGYVDDLGALGNEDALLGVKAIAELSLCERGEDGECGVL